MLILFVCFFFEKKGCEEPEEDPEDPSLPSDPIVAKFVQLLQQDPSA
jgi:hypothetical protein